MRILFLTIALLIPNWAYAELPLAEVHRLGAYLALVVIQGGGTEAPTSDACESCGGTGRLGDGRVEQVCPDCKGTGKNPLGDFSDLPSLDESTPENPVAPSPANDALPLVDLPEEPEDWVVGDVPDGETMRDHLRNSHNVMAPQNMSESEMEHLHDIFHRGESRISSNGGDSCDTGTCPTSDCPTGTCSPGGGGPGGGGRKIFGRLRNR